MFVAKIVLVQGWVMVSKLLETSLVTQLPADLDDPVFVRARARMLRIFHFLSQASNAREVRRRLS